MKLQNNDWWLELGVLGKLSAPQQEEFDQTLTENKELQEKVKKLHESNHKISEQYPLETEWKMILDHLKNMQPQQKKFSIAPQRFMKRFGLAAAFSIVLFSAVLWIALFQRSITSDIFQTRIKGNKSQALVSPRLNIFRLKKGQFERLTPLSRIQSGDNLQLAYHPGNCKYGVIYSIDGNGSVTLHFPEYENLPTLLEPHGWVYLKNAIQMDDAPAFERFFFIASPFPIDARSFFLQAKESGKAPEKVREKDPVLPSSCHLQSILLIKK